MELGIKKLDKYIFRKFITTFLVAMLLIIVIVIIFDISEKVDKFVAQQVPLREIVFDYYLNFIPYFINMYSPLFVFITVIFFTSRMAADSEIIAMLSGGISYRRILAPYLVAAALIAGLSLALNLFVIPQANKTRLKFESHYIKTRNVSIRNAHYQVDPGTFVFVESYGTWNDIAYKFTIENVKDNKLVSKITSESAVWDSLTAGWQLKKYIRRDYVGPVDEKVSIGKQLDTVLSLTRTDFCRNRKTVETLDCKELNDYIRTQKSRGDADVMYAEIEKHTRNALPFSAFILAIMGVTISSRKKRGGIGWNLAAGIALAFSYILFLKFSQMFVYAGTMGAALALWIPNMLFTAVAVILYAKAQK